MVKRMNLTKASAAAALSGLLLASPWAWAAEAHHPSADEGAVATQAGSESGATPSGSGGMPMGGSTMMGQGMPGGQGRQSEGETKAAPGETGQAGRAMGMPMGGPGMKGGRGMMGGMMQRKMMAHRQGMRGGGMMGPGKGGGPMGCGMQQHGYSRLLGRIEVLEARITALQSMLERLLER